MVQHNQMCTDSFFKTTKKTTYHEKNYFKCFDTI